MAEGTASILSSTIESNTAGTYGGGISIQGNYDGTNPSDQDLSLISQFKIEDCQVIGNTCREGKGGGVLVSTGSNGTITATHFDSNTNEASFSDTLGGGGLAHSESSTDSPLMLILSGVSFANNVDENGGQAHDIHSFQANTVVSETCPTQDGYYFLAREGAAITVNDDTSATGTLSSFTCLPPCAPGEDRKTPADPCTACDAGKYGNDGLYECSTCLAGSFNGDSGSTSVAACSACSPGT
jgi:hypothetical protein